MNNIGYNIGYLIGSLGIGAILGLIPLAICYKAGQRTIGLVLLIACAGAPFALDGLGLLIFVAAAIGVALWVRKNKPSAA